MVCILFFKLMTSNCCFRSSIFFYLVVSSSSSSRIPYFFFLLCSFPIISSSCLDRSYICVFNLMFWSINFSFSDKSVSSPCFCYFRIFGCYFCPRSSSGIDYFCFPFKLFDKGSLLILYLLQIRLIEIW